MNRKPPSFPFYAKDWKSSLVVRRMTAQQRGFYIQLLAEAWDSSEPGFIPDQAPLWWVAGASSQEEFLPSKDIILSCFKRDNRGRYYSQKLVEVRNQQVAWRQKCSMGGKKSRMLTSQKNNHLSSKVTSTIPVEVTVAKANCKSKLQAAREKFEVPTIPQIENYMADQGFSNPHQTAVEFFHHYEARDWKPKGYTQRMKSWKSTVITWKKNGFRRNGNGSVEEFEKRFNENFDKAVAASDRLALES